MGVTVKETVKKDDQSHGADNSSQLQGSPNLGGNFLSKVLSSYSSNTMDAATDVYLTNIRKGLEDPSNKISITMKKLNAPNGTVAFITKKSAVILIFTSVCDISVNDIKAQRRQIEAAASFRSMFQNHQLLSIILVAKTDYEKYAQMGTFILNNLQMAEDASLANFNIDVLSKFQMTVDIDKETVLGFMARNSPHGIQSRADFGFILSAANKQDGAFQQQNQHSEMQLLGVTGYTEFVETMDQTNMSGNGIKYTPIVHISDVIGTIPIAKILTLALPLAVEIFCSNGLWRQNYMGLKKTEPHPGNLIISPKDGKPWTAKNQTEMTGFFQQYMNPPIVVIDIVEGRARIPGIERFLFESQHGEILKEFGTFLNIPGAENAAPILLGRPLYTEVVGNVRAAVPAGFVDSRVIDFLYMVLMSGYDARFEELKTRFLDTNRRMEFIATISEFDKLYLSTVFQINSEFIRDAGRTIASKLNFYNPAQANIPTISLDYTMGNFSSFSMMGNSMGAGSNVLQRNIYSN